MDFHSLMGRASTMMSGKRNDDGMTDRLNYRYTVGILVVFAIINLNRLYTYQVRCWVTTFLFNILHLLILIEFFLFCFKQVPAFFTPNYDEYVRSVCFVQNTYYVKHTDKIPKTYNAKKESELLYYQWIPFLLLVQAFLFCIPRMSWTAFGSRSGVQVSDLVESSFDYKQPTTDAIHRQMCLNYVVDSIDQYCNDHRRQAETRTHLNIFRRILTSSLCITGKYLGNYLFVLYMTTKLMYIGVSLFQIYLLGIMLGSNFAFYGIQVLDRFLRGKKYISFSVNIKPISISIGIQMDTESHLFPKTTLCDFTIREFGHPKLAHEYTVPCVLILNLFNEQMFTFLYFWYVIVMLLNIFDFFLWLHAGTLQNRFNFIRKRLHSKKHPLTKQINDPTKILAFTKDYLEADGFFILSLIKENSSDYVAAEIVHRLYTEKFLKKYLHETLTINDHLYIKKNNDTKRYHLCSMIC